MKPATTHQKPSIFDFIDYREFLHATIVFLKLNGKFSVRKFAEEVGFKSYGYLTMILKRERNLSIKSAQKIVDGLHLSKNEAEFFLKLVHFNQSRDPEDKDKAFQDLFFFKKFKASRKVDANSYEFFSHWYIVALLEALGTSLRRANVEELAAAIRIDTRDVKYALEVLERLNFIEKDGTGWKRLETSFETEPVIQDLSVRKFHREMIQKALDSIDALATEERELGSLTISLSASKFAELKERLFQFKQELNALYSEDPDPENVYQLNFQFFPLARVKN